MDVVLLLQNLVVVSLLESFIAAGYKVIIFISSFLLMLICLLGFTVYHIKMWKDPNSGASLLNKIYTRTALLSQARSVTWFLRILLILTNQKTNITCFLQKISAFLQMFSVVNITFLTAVVILKVRSSTRYQILTSQEIAVKIILVAQPTIAAVIFIVMILTREWRMCDYKYLLHQMSLIAGPTQIICLLTLLKIAQENYQLIQKTWDWIINMKKKLVTWIAQQNCSVAPAEPGLHPAPEVAALPPIDNMATQVPQCNVH